jgi:hypothetical protein
VDRAGSYGGMESNGRIYGQPKIMDLIFIAYKSICGVTKIFKSATAMSKQPIFLKIENAIKKYCYMNIDDV